MYTNFYQILGVQRNATDKEIKCAYRMLVYHFHPDRNVNSERDLLDINEAYSVLSNPISRAKYDRTLPEYDSFVEETPKIKWLNEVLGESNKLVDCNDINSLRGIKKDTINLMKYLSVAPLYELYSYSDGATAVVHSLHKRY